MTTSDRVLTVVWVLLIGATVSAGWLAENERGVRWAGMAMLLIASAKIGLIVSHFMEVRFAPFKWKGIFAAWLCLVTAAVLASPLLARP
jgi:hypothetical protein